MVVVDRRETGAAELDGASRRLAMFFDEAALITVEGIVIAARVVDLAGRPTSMVRACGDSVGGGGGMVLNSIFLNLAASHGDQ